MLPRLFSLILVAPLTASGPLPAASPGAQDRGESPEGRTFYVRQTVGEDHQDGLTPETAWRSISTLSDALRAGDTAYVAPGLYRDQITLRASGTPEAPIRLIADSRGSHTGDPPGVVMITGAEPVNEEIFEPYSSPGVYLAPFAEFHVGGVVEMDGAQYRYRNVLEPVPDIPYVEVVAKHPATFFYDRDAKVLYLHTSDGQPPTTHEIELMRRTGGISMTNQHHVIIEGFTFRHMVDAGIVFWVGSSDSMAVGNVSYGSRQGIRVNNASNILIVANTLFRNENSGVYFLRESVDGQAIGNTLYENAKGIRWGSQSNNGLAAANVAFDNREAGISVEDTSGTRIAGNRLINNGRAQLLAIKSSYQSESNCFRSGSTEQLTADLYFRDRFSSLDDYQSAKGRDMGSKTGDCGSTPEKLEVRRLHSEALTYAAGEQRPPSGPIGRER